MAYQEYPRMIYGADGETRIISCKEEWPKGFFAAPGEVPVPKAKRAEDRKAETAATTADKQKRQRAEDADFLDRHNVAYSPDLTLGQLDELAAQLRAHLAGKSAQ